MNLFASLGGDCYVTWTIRRCGFQQMGSFPLDWINSYEFGGVGKFFDLAWKKELEKLMDLPLSAFDPPLPEILAYPDLKLRFPHEFGEKNIIDRQSLVEKYKRRFSRLKSLSQDVKHLWLIRQVAPSMHDQPAETESEYLENIPNVIESIETFIGHRNFTILLMSQDDFFSSGEDLHEKIITINNIQSFSGGYLEAEKQNNWDHQFFKNYTQFFKGLENISISNTSVNDLYRSIFKNTLD
jgi:hypothetical protein